MTESTRTRRRFLVGATGTALAVGLAGCSSGQSEEDPDQDDSGHVDTAGEVAMTTSDSGTHFEPHVVRIEPGEAVTWVNESGSHSTTAYAEANDKPDRIPSEADAWDSGTLSEEGDKYQHTFETEGVYDYYCRPHESAGMLGSVVVGDPHLDDEPGMAEAQSSLPEGAHDKIHELNEMVHSGGEGEHTDSHDDEH